MLNNRKYDTKYTDQINNKDIFTRAMPEAGVSSNTITLCMSLLDNGLFKEELSKRRLYQAIIDNNQKRVRKILDINPAFLLLKPKNMVIDSVYTHQKFNLSDESPLDIAVKRKQVEMIELLLPYYDKIENKEAALKSKEKSLSAWTFYDTRIDKNNKEEIIIPEKYATYLQEIIDVIKDETSDYEHLHEKTENKLKELFTRLLPEKPVKLDDYFDVELLLLAAYQAYRDKHDSLSGNQLQILAIRVIGLILTMQSPELAKIFCDGVKTQVEAIKKGEKKEIKGDSVAAHLKIKGGQSFYRSSRDSHSGAGFNFLCGMLGWSEGRWACTESGGRLQFLCQAKASNFQNLCSHTNTRKFGV